MHFTPPRFILVLCLITLSPFPALAARNFSRNSWNMRLGVAVSNLFQRLDAPSGFESKVSQLQGILGIERQIFFSKRLGVSPNFHVWLPWRNGADGTAFTVTTHLAVPFFWEFASGFQLLLGPGLFGESHFSKQESVVLGNGGGSSTFYTPWRTRQVILLSAFGGVKVNVSKKFGLFLGVFSPEFNQSNKRRLHASGGISIRL